MYEAEEDGWVCWTSPRTTGLLFFFLVAIVTPPNVPSIA